jgi:Glycosyltransferase family 87
MDTRRLGAGAGWDAVLYGASCLAALAVLSTSDGPLDLQWARMAAFGYGIGALAAWLLSRRAAGIRARAILGVAVFAAVAVVPTIVQAGARSEAASAHVKSDVLVVEQAAAALLEGRNPYALVHDDGPLAAWPAWAQDHFPYLAATIAAGTARALAGPEPWTDARLLSLALALAVAVPSILWSGASAEWRLRAFLVLFVLATGAPLVVTSGKEILVLGLLAASLVALRRSHPSLSGVAAGSAAAMHQLAWVVLPLFALMRPGSGGRRAAAIGTATGLAAVVPFLVWDAGAFVQDAILYPLGFDQPADASPFTPGGLLAVVLPDWRWPMIAVTVLAAGACAAVAISRGVRTPADVARWAGTLLLVVMIVAPRVRLAYFAFPANLLVWSRMLREDRAFDSSRPRGHAQTSWPMISDEVRDGVHAHPHA